MNQIHFFPTKYSSRRRYIGVANRSLLDTNSRHRIIFDMSRVKTSFVLHSETHRRLYPASQFPLTHFVDRQNVARQCFERRSFLRPAFYWFLSCFVFTLFVCAFFRTHLYLYNEFSGPFHVNHEALEGHVTNYNKHSWCQFRREYFQVELGGDNIRNPASSAETIRVVSDPETRRNHIATFEKVYRLSIYVKLPTRSMEYFHRRFPFDFRLFNLSTLKCVAKRLISDSNNTHAQWLDKSDYVSFIDGEYARNSTRFNSLVLSKCGVLVGYLYRSVYEIAFNGSRKHDFYPTTVAFDVSSAHASTLSLLFQSFLCMMLFLRGIYSLSIYLVVFIRGRCLHPRGISSFHLEFSADLVEELYLLNSDAPVEQQSLQLDSYLARSEHRFRNRMFIIENDAQHMFVLFLQVNPNSPFS